MKLTKAKTLFSYLIIVVFIAIGFVRCSPEKQFRTLSFFFDGVPDPSLKPKQVTNPDYADSLSQVTFLANAKNTDGFIHRPYGENKCTSCHANGFSNALIKPMPELCYTCHDDFNNRYQTLHGPVASGNCMGCHDQHESKFDKLLRRDGQDLCLVCHEAKQVLANKVHKTIEKTSCLECHNPHGGTNRGFLNQGVCYKCHENFNAKYNVLHGPVASGNCTACHGLHNSQTAKLLTRESQEICLFCHNPEQVFKNVAHKDAQKKECTACHNPHGGEDRFVLIPSIRPYITKPTWVPPASDSKDGTQVKAHEQTIATNDSVVKVVTNVSVPAKDNTVAVVKSDSLKKDVVPATNVSADSLKKGENNLAAGNPTDVNTGQNGQVVTGGNNTTGVPAGTNAAGTNPPQNTNGTVSQNGQVVTGGNNTTGVPAGTNAAGTNLPQNTNGTVGQNGQVVTGGNNTTGVPAGTNEAGTNPPQNVNGTTGQNGQVSTVNKNDASTNVSEVSKGKVDNKPTANKKETKTVTGQNSVQNADVKNTKLDSKETVKKDEVSNEAMPQSQKNDLKQSATVKKQSEKTNRKNNKVIDNQGEPATSAENSTAVTENLKFQINFKYNVAYIDTTNGAFKEFITNLTELYKKNSNINLVLISSASQVPTRAFKSNRELSETRAQKAKEQILFALKERGVDISRVVFVKVSSYVNGPAYQHELLNNTSYYEPYQFIKARGY